MADSLLRMGTTRRPHGINGEISADWEGEKHPAEGDEIFLQAGDSEPVLCRVVSSRVHKGRILLALDGITDRDQAEGLRDMTILIPRDAVSQPGEDEAFVQDLPGSKIYLKNGEYLGLLDHVEYPAGQMIWIIHEPDGNEVLFPAEPCFIDSLDMDKREAVIDPPEGLLDIYRA